MQLPRAVRYCLRMSDRGSVCAAWKGLDHLAPARRSFTVGSQCPSEPSLSIKMERPIAARFSASGGHWPLMWMCGSVRKVCGFTKEPLSGGMAADSRCAVPRSLAGAPPSRSPATVNFFVWNLGRTPVIQSFNYRIHAMKKLVWRWGNIMKRTNKYLPEGQ